MSPRLYLSVRELPAGAGEKFIGFYGMNHVGGVLDGEGSEAESYVFHNFDKHAA